MTVLRSFIFVLLLAGSSEFDQSSDPGKLYEDTLHKTQTYGRCWFDAMQVAKSHCEDHTSSRTIGRVGLEIYNCFLEKSESRRIECSPDQDVAKCEALVEEIREKTHRQLFMESRNRFIVFCEQWKTRGHPQILETFTDGAGASGSEAIPTIFFLARSSMESFLRFSSILWRWSQSGLDWLLGLLGEYQLQNQLNHACNHCKSSVSQLFASIEIFIDDTQRMWQLYLTIVATDMQQCPHDQDDTPLNLVGSLLYMVSLFFCVNLTIQICKWTWLSNDPFVVALCTSLLLVELNFEGFLIRYALNNCHGTSESRFDFLHRNQADIRSVFFKISGAVLALALLRRVVQIIMREK